ncbi:hypothetical protein HGRIS_006389 [Hohenbuehelia grisea]|uniref:MADS-box domain-containing protein n=1 Tax=Hohenbuehelia grisea TaxID=104357 RepID=A0ABR3JZS6_9AGAR
MRKRQRTIDAHNPADPQVQQSPTQPGQPVTEDAFINDHDAVDSGADDDDDEVEKPKSDKKAGRRKIKIEFIQDKSRRHITFSKRKAGIMKKAYELSTLTGTQVLLLVVSETGLVYTFTTAKLQPLVTQPEGKNLIQACLNAPHGTLPSSMPVGPSIGRSSPMSISPGQPTPGASNLPGGLSINAPPGGGAPLKDDDGPDEDDRDGPGANKRRRRASSAASRPAAGQTSPHSPNASIPPPLNIPGAGAGGQQAAPQGSPPQQPQVPPPQISLGSPTSPQQGHSVPGGGAPYSPTGYAPQHHSADPSGGSGGMYGGHMMGAPQSYSYSPQGTQNGPGQQQLGGLASAPQQHGHWPQQQYQRR